MSFEEEALPLLLSLDRERLLFLFEEALSFEGDVFLLPLAGGERAFLASVDEGGFAALPVLEPEESGLSVFAWLVWIVFLTCMTKDSATGLVCNQSWNTMSDLEVDTQHVQCGASRSTSRSC